MSWAVTYPTQIIPWGAGDCSAVVAGTRPILRRVLVDIHDTNILEGEIRAPKTRRDRASAVQRPNVCQNAVLARACGVAELLWGVPQWQTCEKNHEFFLVFKWEHHHRHPRKHFQ